MKKNLKATNHGTHALYSILFLHWRRHRDRDAEHA